ncbi:MAG: hypothetical protein JW384_00579 [Nitrosomonadaceae bacterium]|jgi:negative regulator of sigma E activity|nr:hypothetical protein [Nitrosospira sp.]MBI0412147.1 hypothetical protein [Nitrosospira sp.]MCG3769457.1 hypothetical protein [Nitrosomonadaceae bacterium]
MNTDTSRSLIDVLLRKLLDPAYVRCLTQTEPLVGRVSEEMSSYIDSELVSDNPRSLVDVILRKLLEPELEGSWIESTNTGDRTRSLIETIRSNADARNDWFLYHLVGDAMRGKPINDDGFSVRILARLEGVEIEPSYNPLAPSD